MSRRTLLLAVAWAAGATLLARAQTTGPAAPNPPVPAATAPGASVPSAAAGQSVPPPVASSSDGSHARILGLTGAPNFRDVGGYATTDHRHLRWGLVYRSNALGKLTPDDAARIEQLDLKAVVDLRTLDERSQAPSIWIRRPDDVYESPKASLRPVLATVLENAQTPEGARAGMEAFYASMPDRYRDEYAAMFRRIAAGELPILVHCTAGKDRTGVAMAVLLRSLKVPRAQVVADYELSERLGSGPDMAKQPTTPAGEAPVQSALGRLPEASREVLRRSSPDYVEAALDSIDREYGSVEKYLTTGLGLAPADIAAVRRNLTR